MLLFSVRTLSEAVIGLAGLNEGALVTERFVAFAGRESREAARMNAEENSIL